MKPVVVKFDLGTIRRVEAAFRRQGERVMVSGVCVMLMDDGTPAWGFSLTSPTVAKTAFFTTSPDEWKDDMLDLIVGNMVEAALKEDKE